MQPKRTPGACFKCGSSDHQRNSCPQNRPRPPGNRNHFGPSNAAMVLQTTGPVTPAYIVPLLFKFPSGDSTQISAVIDTGSPVSLIKQALIPIVTEISEPTVSSGIVGINGSELVILGDVFVDITPLDSQFPINVKLNVVPDTTIKCDCLLGRNFLSHPNVIFNIDNGNFEIEFKRLDIVPFNEILSLEIVSEQTELDIDIEMTLPHNVKTDVRNIFYKNYLSDNNCDHKLNYNAVIPSSEIEIELKDSNVFYFNPRRLSYYEKNELQKILDTLLSQKVIRPSSSEYSSAIVLVKKKNGELRLCVDYRELNKRTVRDRYPLPLIDDHLDTLRGKNYFTCIDLKDGFHHISVAENSRKFTSFVTPLGQFEYCKMPFGLCNGPSKFQRYVNEIFSEQIKAKKIVIYFDDIVIATETIDTHLSILSEILTIMKLNKLQIRLDKSQFLKTEIVYLGYLVNSSGICPNPKNVSVIQNYPIPCNQKALHSFIGLASYFRRFIPNFSTIANPLYDILKKNVPFSFGEDKLIVFESIKQKLSEHPILCLYNPNAETELHCDASSLGFGSILL